MKLELKHLALYLPYNLMMGNTSDKLISPRELVALGEDYFILHLNYGHEIYEGSKRNINSSGYKPILNPINDLNKPFIKGGVIKLRQTLTKLTNDILDCIMDKDADIENIKSIPQRDYEKLVSRHFDVFGLIEKGLAIDRNTIKNV